MPFVGVLPQEFHFEIGTSSQGGEPLFVSLNNNVSPISSGVVNSAVKRVAKFLGPASNITGHSLRIGGCTAAAAPGVPMEIIRSATRWGLVQRRDVGLHSGDGRPCAARHGAYGSVRFPLVRHSQGYLEKARLLGLKSMCSTAEARHSRALAESTAMPAPRG